MPSVFLHQNMRVFGGAALVRNAAYNGAFARINQAAAAAGPISVMGFTEIVNAGAALGALGALAGVLAPGSACVAVACGITALANGPEFVGIATAPGFAILSVGRIVLQDWQGRVTLFHDIAPAVPPPALWASSAPAQATPDYRGVVYVVVLPVGGGVSFAVGFLHNMYTRDNERALVMEQIPQMLRLMAGDPAGPAHVYLGGDFNVPPQDRGTGRTGRAYGYTAAVTPGTVSPVALAAGASVLGTTWSGSLYDYWYSDINPNAPPVWPFIVPVPRANGATMDTNLQAGTGFMSDHCAALLTA